jgi:tellurite resistance protein TehA-like permease
MAFRYALSPLIPYHDSLGTAWDDAVPQVLSALTNVVFVILFVLWQLKQSPRPGMFVRIALACLLLNLYWFVSAWRDSNLKDLLVGYYVWLAAFALLLAVASIIAYASRRTSKTPTADTPS